MSTVMEDPARSKSPLPPAKPAEPVEPAIRLVPGQREDLRGYRFEREGAEASFDLESPGGYARTVVGTFAYLDAPAQTYVVRGRDGELMRVPLRDIKTTRVGSGTRSGAADSVWDMAWVPVAEDLVRTFVSD